MYQRSLIPREDETDQICNGDEVARLFNEDTMNENGPLDQEEPYVEEV